MDTMLSPERIFGPRADIGYFPSKKDNATGKFPNAVTIEACEQDFKRFARKFDLSAIRFLKHALVEGTVHGCFTKKGLLGTLGRALGENPDELCARIGHAGGLNNPAEYWFWQISPRFINGKKIYDRCLFTETAIRWCDDLITEKSHE